MTVTNHDVCRHVPATGRTLSHARRDHRGSTQQRLGEFPRASARREYGRESQCRREARGDDMSKRTWNYDGAQHNGNTGRKEVVRAEDAEGAVSMDVEMVVGKFLAGGGSPT